MTNGNTSVSILGYYSLKFSWWQESQSVVDNTTTIGWKLDFISENGALYVYSKPWEVNIDGTSFTGTSHILVDNGKSTTLASGTSVIHHNDNGSKTFPYSFKLTINVTLNNGKYVGTYSGADSGALDNIVRASKPSCSAVGEFGNEITIYLNRSSDEFTHTVRYHFGEETGTIATNVGGEVTWVIPDKLMDLIPNSISGTGTILADTYKGTDLLGTMSCLFTANVPESITPSCSCIIEDINGIQDIYGNPVKGLSRLRVTVDAVEAYSSPIVSYSITANGVKYSSSPATTGVLATSGVNTVSVSVTDSRGRSATVNYDIEVYDYAAPTITALSVKRCDENGNLNRRGDHLKVTFSAVVTALDEQNTALYYLLHKQTSDTAYDRIALSDLMDQHAVDGYVYILPASQSKSFDIVVEATDRHGTASRLAKAPTASAIYSWRGFRTENGIEDGLGIGKVAEKPKTLQIEWATEFIGPVSGSIFNAIYPVGSIFCADTSIDPNVVFTGTWESSTDGEVVVWHRTA